MEKNFIGRQDDRQRGGREAVESRIDRDFGKGDKKFREIGNLTKWQGYIWDKGSAGGKDYGGTTNITRLFKGAA